MHVLRASCGALLLLLATPVSSLQVHTSRAVGMRHRATATVMASRNGDSFNSLTHGVPGHQLNIGPYMAPAAPQIAKPKTAIKHATYTGSPGGGGKPGGAAATVTAKPKQLTEDCPRWKVILLGDEEYEEDPVCDALVRVIPDVSNLMQAKEKYQEAQRTGKSLLIVVPKEHAELYKEQLQREDPMVFADIEEE